jgi:translocation and assembly module TamB
MTPSPGPEQQPEPQRPGSRRRSRAVFARTGLGLGAIVVAGGAIGGLWLWRFVYTELAPLVERNLSQLLNRPVELGRVQQVTPTSLVFGPSALPPTPTDRDRVTVERVEVQFNPLTVLTDRRLGLTVTLIRPQAFLDQTPDGEWIQTRVETQEEEGPIKTELDRIAVRDGTLVLEPDPRAKQTTGTGTAAATVTRSQVTIRQFNGGADLSNGTQDIRFDLAAALGAGTAQVNGETQREAGNTKFSVRADQLPAAEVSTLIPIPVTAQGGALFANTEVLFLQNELSAINGTARVQNITARAANLPQPITQASGQFRFRDRLITLEQGTARYGQIPARFNGNFHLDNGYDLRAQLRGVSVDAIRKTIQAQILPVPITGRFDADVAVTGPLDQPLVSGTLTSQGITRVDRIDFDTIRSGFAFQNQVLTLREVMVTPVEGGVVTGGGQVTLGNTPNVALTLNAQDLPGDPIARRYGANTQNFRLGRVQADVRVAGRPDAVQTRVVFRAPGALYPMRGTLAIADNRIQIQQAEAQVAGGTVTARGNITAGQLQATVRSADVQLRQLSPQLRGVFSGDAQLAANLNNFSLRNLRAEGNVNLSQGVAVLNGPLRAEVRWLGDRLQIDRATAPGFSADGAVLARVEGQGAPAITALDLNLNLRDYNLATFPVTLPNQVRLAGRGDFDGRVTGTPSAPMVAGNLRLNNLAVNRLRFEPVLSGSVNFAGGRETTVDLRGANDRIAITLDRRFRPTTLNVRAGDAVAEGRTVGDRLTASLTRFPLDTLNLTPAANIGLGPITGLATGNLDVNLANFASVGNLTVERPGIGYIVGDCFTGQFRYANGQATLFNSQLLQLDRGSLRGVANISNPCNPELAVGSRYRLNGSVTLGNNPRFQGQVEAAHGRIQDVLAALQIFELSDFRRGIGTPAYGRAADLTVVPVGNPDDTLLNQLRRFTEISTLLQIQQNERAEANYLPDLSTAIGEFTGTLNFSGSARTGIAFNFDLQGQNWRWGKYQAEQAIAKGEFSNGQLRLLPVRLQSGDSFLNYSGTVGGSQQSGQLQAQNVPADLVQELFRLPIDIAGNLNANASLEGNLQNPLARGQITLSNGAINRTPIQDFNTSFLYEDARLRVISRLLVDGSQPLRLTGSIPLALGATQPDSDAISLDVNVQDEGLAILNIFTNQVAFRGGRGNVDLQVSGTLREPLITGAARLDNATFSSPALPEPLTNVTGNVQFNRTLIQVDGLQGQFRQGQVVARGALPIFNVADLPQSPVGNPPVNPLAIALNEVALNFKGLYRGGVNGQLQILGTALAPRIGGNILLSNGRVELPSGAQTSLPAVQPPQPGGITTPPQLNNLQITLGPGTQIVLDPVLNFVASGDLLINGPLGNLRPRGVIQLRAGQVNLFTTQFYLARGYENTAEFLPNRGLDPILNVRLSTSVPEVTRTPVRSTTDIFPPSEIQETLATNFGAIDTVRIQATATGPASQLFDNLELTSNPSRSREEIIALLGGGFVDTLGRGDSTLAIANLAGSALLTSLQNIIRNTLGLTDFRLFPTTSTSRRGNTTLGLASELGIDITGQFSVSVLQILTTPSPTQFNLRYRLNDQFLLRGYVDTSGATGAVLEFETRF